MTEYRTDDADEGEGWPRARTDHFTFAANDGPWQLEIGESDVADVSMWAATGGPVADVVVALAADAKEDEDCSAAALAYYDADAARAFAAQVLTAATAAEAGEDFNPNHDDADDVYR